jgi:thioredoxin-like negative regulator of GroEL
LTASTEEHVMARRRLAWIVLLLGGLLVAVRMASWAQEAPGAAEIHWRTDYAAALKEALEKNLPLLIDFGTVNCYYCRKLDESTFRDPRIIAVMNQRFIPLKVDGEREAGLVQQLGITSYPTIVVAGPDKRILGTMVGYKEAETFHDSLQRVLATLAPSDWMTRDLQNAAKSAAAGDFARAIPLLRTLLEDSRAAPMHPQAGKLLQEIDARGTQQLAQARELQAKGQTAEAIEAFTETMRLYPGLDASKGAAAALAQMVKAPDVQTQHRTKRARDLLLQAKEFYQSKDYIPCLDRCETILATFGDLPEGLEANKLAADIKRNPDWLQGACDAMADRLGGLYLALADSLLKRGEAQRAEFYLQRVIQAFPGSRQAESAQIRLTQLQGLAPRKGETQSAGP